MASTSCQPVNPTCITSSYCPMQICSLTLYIHFKLTLRSSRSTARPVCCVAWLCRSVCQQKKDMCMKDAMVVAGSEWLDVVGFRYLSMNVVSRSFGVSGSIRKRPGFKPRREHRYLFSFFLLSGCCWVYISKYAFCYSFLWCSGSIRKRPGFKPRREHRYLFSFFLLCKCCWVCVFTQW